MPKMPHTRQHHDHAALVGGCNHFFIAHAAAGLDNAGGTGIDHHIQTIKGVGYKFNVE